LPLPFFEQAVLAPNALQGAMAEREVELADEAASAESEQLLAKSNHLLFHLGGSFARLVMRSTGKLDQAARSLLLITPQPLTHGGNGGLKQTGGGLDAWLPSRLYQTQAMVVSVSHLANQDEVGGGHSGL
jgi:hypothetical protein